MTNDLPTRDHMAPKPVPIPEYIEDAIQAYGDAKENRGATVFGPPDHRAVAEAHQKMIEVLSAHFDHHHSVSALLDAYQRQEKAGFVSRDSALEEAAAECDRLSALGGTEEKRAVAWACAARIRNMKNPPLPGAAGKGE